MTTPIETTNATFPTEFKFKNAKLNQVSIKIARIGNNIQAQNFELAKCLGTILHTKCYEEDGFKSVADFAEQIFGIKKALAYQLARTGERFYNNPDLTDKVRDISSKLSPSKLAELVNLEDNEIEKAIEDGTITEESTQKELRAIATSPKTASVLAEYDIHAIIFTMNERSVIDIEKIVKADIATAIGIKDGIFTAISLPEFEKDNDFKIAYVTAKDLSSHAIVQYTKHKISKKVQSTKPTMTKEQITAMFTADELKEMFKDLFKQ